MLLYIILLVVAVFNCSLSYKYQRYLGSLLFIVMMFLCGFRAYDVGRDTPNYVFAAENIDRFSINWGPIYYLLILLSQYTKLPATTFLFFMALLTYLPLVYVCRKVSVKPGLTTLLYMIPTATYFFESFNLARQILAISYILLAAVCLYKDKLKLSIMITVFAFFLHPYTVFFCCFYFIYRLQFSKRTIYILILGTSFLGVLGVMNFVYDILEYMNLIFENSSFSMLAKFAKYGNSEFEIESNYTIIGQLSHIVPLSSICLVGANNQCRDNIFYKMMVCGCVILNLFIGVIYCERIASTFTIAQIIAIPYMYKYAKQRDKILYFVVLVFTAVIYLYNLHKLSLNSNIWTPYHTIFD